MLYTNNELNEQSSFDKQTITLTDDITKFKYYECIYVDQKDVMFYQTTGLLPVSLKARLSGGSNVHSHRDIIEIQGNKVTFDNAIYYTSYNGYTSVDNVMCIPYQIIGFK